MTPSSDWPRIAVVGTGAVGGYFGARFAHAGAPVVLIGRQPFVQAVERDGLYVDSATEPLHVRVRASTELSASADADIVLLCVKTFDTVATVRALAPHLAPRALLLTLQNGVQSGELIRETIQRDSLAAAVYVAVSVSAPGHVGHFGRGDLSIGPDAADTQRLARLCARAGIPCRIAANILGELWAKLLLNCALNAPSALAQASYARLSGSPDARELIAGAVAEVVQVAYAAGVRLPEWDDAEQAFAAVLALAAQMPEQRSSMAQDLSRGRCTEIDALNGYVQRRGAALGVRTPINQALCALVELAQGEPACR